MPCIFISGQNFANPIIPGDTTIGSGTSNERDMPNSFYYNYSYSGTLLKASQLSAIPNGATINRIEWEYEIVTNGTYTINNVDMYMFQTPQTYTAFPSNTQVSGQSSTDTTWNNSITNYFQTEYSTTIDFVHTSADQNIKYRGFNLTNSYANFDNTKNLAIVFLNNDGNYQGGTQSYPRVKGSSTNNGGTCYFEERDSSPYTLTTFVNKQLSFFPNLKIYWS
tara:strand:- start:2255 stop:2920 length:666 start_codon:yes stop_codon:yes gene_type:complete